MNEYTITFINEEGIYQELTFRGVSEHVATALATGLNRAPFEQVRLQIKESRDVNVPLGTILLPDLPPVEPAVDPVTDAGVTGSVEPEQPVGRSRK